MICLQNECLCVQGTAHPPALVTVVTPPPRLSWPPRGWTELAASHRNTPTWIHKYRTSLNFCLKCIVCVPTLTGPPRSGFHLPESGAESCLRSPGGRRWRGRPPSSTGPGSAAAGSRRSGPGEHVSCDGGHHHTIINPPGRRPEATRRWRLRPQSRTAPRPARGSQWGISRCRTENRCFNANS